MATLRGFSSDAAGYVGRMRHNGEITTDITSGVAYQTFGPVPSSVRDTAEQMMQRLAEIAPRAVLYAKIKVSSSSEGDPNQKIVVQGTMDVSGSVVRAQAAAPNPTEALKSVEDRLQRRINRLAARRPEVQTPSCHFPRNLAERRSA